jgi:hypothetical protein
LPHSTRSKISTATRDFPIPSPQQTIVSFRIAKSGLVVPQQSLRGTIKDVFRKTRGLHPDMVMTPFQVGEVDVVFDLLIVDETHRLSQRANQPSGVLNGKFTTITRELFGSDDFSKSQLDWILAKSRRQIFLLDAMQSVRPADLPQELLSGLVADTRATGRISSCARKCYRRAQILSLTFAGSLILTLSPFRERG